MRIGKLVALGLAAAVVPFAAVSSAGPNTNLMSLSVPEAKVATNNSMDITVYGTGKCVTRTKVIDPNGEVTTHPVTQLYGITFPYKTVVTPKVPGVHKVIVTTESSQYTPGCPGGQEVATTMVAFKEPTCPPNWQVTYFDKNSGKISCVPKQPVITCSGKNEAFFTPSNAVCQAGCESAVY